MSGVGFGGATDLRAERPDDLSGNIVIYQYPTGDHGCVGREYLLYNRRKPAKHELYAVYKCNYSQYAHAIQRCGIPVRNI